jgi:hypothetical protein
MLQNTFSSSVSAAFQSLCKDTHSFADMQLILAITGILTRFWPFRSVSGILHSIAFGKLLYNRGLRDTIRSQHTNPLRLSVPQAVISSTTAGAVLQISGSFRPNW